jgi:O-antigen biosynthesis protein
LSPETQATLWYKAARLAGWVRPRWRLPARPPAPGTPAPGISVVIPSRNGRELLAAQLPGIVRELEPFAHEILVVDNGSQDYTDAWLRAEWPQAQALVSRDPLSFAAAVNLGIGRAGYSHICLLNNDMIVEAGFFKALSAAFQEVPDLFCATAQIFFPPGARREETGKAVLRPSGLDFPVRCDEPLPGEDLTWVLYGSGGCSLYNAAMLRQLGGMDKAYAPAYVEDLDVCYRAWQQGWPSVYVAGAVLEHRHRATSSRYFTEEQLEAILEINYLRFVARAVCSPPVFRRLWKQALVRLKMLAKHSEAARAALGEAAGLALGGGPARSPRYSEETLLALTDGSVAVFPGRQPRGRPRKLIAAPPSDIPAVGDSDPILVTWVDQLAPPPPEILADFVEVVMVRGHEASPAFRAARDQAAAKWNKL